MSKKNKKRSTIPQEVVFSSAGSLNYVGKNYEQDPILLEIQYSADELFFNLKTDLEIEQKPEMVNWFDIAGLHRAEIIGKIGQNFNIHPLLIEDILNTTQKAKIDFFDNDKHIFVILKLPHFDSQSHDIDFEHIAIVLMNNNVLSFQEIENSDVFEPIKSRLKTLPSKTRTHHSDYLFYSMIDIVVDNYYLISSQIEEKISELELEILSDAKPSQQKQLFFLKKEINELKKALKPTKEILNILLRGEDSVITPEVKIYLRDVADHVDDNLEAFDGYKDEIENLISNYHSQLSDRMNSVMKTLTVFTSIFMPLTFIAGIYGMNFKNMPELETSSGYFITLSAMFAIAVLLWWYFRWKKYI